MDNTVKEPLIHLSKREDMSFGRKWLVRIIAILLSLIVCAGFIFIIIKMNPVESSNIEGIGYNVKKHHLWVSFKNNKVYRYDKVLKSNSKDY